MNSQDTIQAIANLGFTSLEAEVYLFLLQESPATGYRVAQGIGKPVGNTYKAVEALENKGAVLVDEGENRRLRAVPAGELIEQLDRSFAERKENASAALARFEAPPPDDGIYQMRSLDQVLERSRRMLNGAERVAVLVATPAVLGLIANEIEAAAARSVAVGVKTYAPTTMKDVEVIIDPRGPEVVDNGPGQWLDLSVDSREMLYALFNFEMTDVLNAIWSTSAYLNWTAYSGLYANVVLPEYERLIENGASVPELRAAMRRYRTLAVKDTPGRTQMMQQYRTGRTRRERMATAAKPEA